MEKVRIQMDLVLDLVQTEENLQTYLRGILLFVDIWCRSQNSNYGGGNDKIKKLLTKTEIKYVISIELN